MRTAVELGPKGKKAVAYAIDWPGLERNGKTEEDAIAHMDSYRSRYRSVAERAKLGEDFAGEPDADVAVTYQGTGSTDFWGISFAHSPIDREELTDEDLDRQLALLQACWNEFDETALRVSAELKKGPRGGGRDRDHIVRHLLAAEISWVKWLGVRPELTDVFQPRGRNAFHQQIMDAMRELHATGTNTDPTSIRFLIRHLAYHVMDHAWEMQDKDLTAEQAG